RGADRSDASRQAPAVPDDPDRARRARLRGGSRRGGGIQGVRPRAHDARGVAGRSARRGCGCRGQLAGREELGIIQHTMNKGEAAALRPRLLVLAAAALFSTGGAAIKSASLTGWQVASLRSAVAVVTLAILLPNSRRRPSPSMILVGVFYAATLILFVQATKLTTAADAIFLQDTAPLYVLLAAPFLLGERVVKADLWFMLALAVGLSFFFVGTEAPIGTAPNPFVGNVAAAASGLIWAGTVIGLRWLGTRSPDGSAMEPALLTGTAISAIVALWPALPITGVSLHDWSIVI